MQRLRQWIGSAALCAVAGFMPAAGATSFSTNYSDLWWIPTESGWGANLTQQADTMFVTLFVYDASSQPVWYVATLDADSTTRFTGDLYRTSGPWLGIPFNPLAVSPHKVGTVTFEASSYAQATLSYSVDGVPVVKHVERQTLRNDTLTGSYFGGTVDVTTDCTNPANDNLRTEDPGQVTVAQSGTAIQIRAPSCTFTGTYVQQGQIGRADTNYVCTSGAVGTAIFHELRIETGGLVGRYTGFDVACKFEGNIGGYRKM